jgi:LPXTG-motif cell wall-anchored protein
MWRRSDTAAKISLTARRSRRFPVYPSGPVLRSRTLIALLALALAVPSAAFAQGAGDDQYQDPFPEQQEQGGGNNGRAAQDDGLTDEPPVPDTPDTPTDPAPPPTDDEPADPEEQALPNTGSEPLLLAYVGVLFLLAGLGLRLRTLDPDRY